MVSTIVSKSAFFLSKIRKFLPQCHQERNEEKPFKIGSSGKLLAPLAKRIWLRVAWNSCTTTNAHQAKLNQGGLDSIKTSKKEDRNHDLIIIQTRLPGLTDLQNNKSAETFVRPGICDFFFLWLSISCSQFVTKRHQMTSSLI